MAGHIQCATTATTPADPNVTNVRPTSAVIARPGCGHCTTRLGHGRPPDFESPGVSCSFFHSRKRQSSIWFVLANHFVLGDRGTSYRLGWRFLYQPSPPPSNHRFKLGVLGSTVEYQTFLHIQLTQSSNITHSNNRLYYSNPLKTDAYLHLPFLLHCL